MTMKKRASLAASSFVLASVTLAHAEPQAAQTTDVLEPNAGTIDAFYGNIDAFYGNIDAFYGNIDAFWGNIDAFWGDRYRSYSNIDPFSGTGQSGGTIDPFYGNIDAFYGNIDAFWGNIDAFFGNIDAFWGNIDPFDSGAGDQYKELFGKILGMFDEAEEVFGPVYELSSGTSFDDGFRNALLEKYGIDPNDPSSLGSLTAEDRARFFMEFHDGLMAHSGRDVIDHWMPRINWSPALSFAAGNGQGVTVGLLDTPITSELVGGQVTKVDGFGMSLVDHGAGVAGVLAGAHDGRGVMGLAPEVKFSVYNPFDSTFTTNWTDVSNGVTDLAGRGASVINMSLGVSGYTFNQGWRDVFSDRRLRRTAQNIVFVKSAGNSGTTQTEDIYWGGLQYDKQLLVVGSVDYKNDISSFSNRPGEACFLTWGVCAEENKLKYRFLVAPGELVLVQDNEGGLSRVSGTSVAAPMVSGAVALLHSRWNWLRQHPEESADIILRSATDLGDPGVDAVYGWGLLNVEASQQPLDPSSLYVRRWGGRTTAIDGTGVTTDLLNKLPDNATVTVFEDIGDTFRDFDLSINELSLQAATAAARAETAMEVYVAASTIVSDWKSGTLGNGKKKLAFDQHTYDAVPLMGGKEATWQLSMAAHSRPVDQAVADDALPFTTSMTLENTANGFSITTGRGVGAVSFTGGDFARLSDYAMETGGVNPVLGLASGGAFANASLPIGEKMALSFGLTERTDEHLYADSQSGELLGRYTGLSDYEASALSMGLDITPVSGLRLGASYTRLDEATGLLGGQGTGLLNLDGGSQTDATTVDLSYQMAAGMRLSASATSALTTGQTGDGSILGYGPHGIQSTAYEVALSKDGVLGTQDYMRLSIAQPLYVTKGGLVVETMDVIDRETGELGAVSETIQLGGKGPRYVTEVLYGAPILDGTGDMTAFTQFQTRGADVSSTGPEVASGIRFSIEY